MSKQVHRFFFLTIFLVLSSPFRPLLAQAGSQKTTISRDSSARIRAGPKVTARVGGYLYNIEGLTSPRARVELKSTQGNLRLTTYANDSGRFHFQNVLVGVRPGQFCFFATDLDRNPSPPLCLDPPAPAPINHISGVILPPSLTMDKGVFRQGDRVNTSGMSLPNAKMEVFVFKEKRPPIFDLLDLVKPAFVTFREVFVGRPAWAKSPIRGARALPGRASPVPKVTISTDEKGRFSLNLPSVRSGRWRIFAGTFWQDNPAAPSHTLEFASLPWWQWMALRVWLAIGAGFRAALAFLFSWPVLVFVQILTIGIVGLKIKRAKP